MKGKLKLSDLHFPMKHVADRNNLPLKENASARPIPSTFFWQNSPQLNEEAFGA